MQIINRCVFGFIAASVSAFAGAQNPPPVQPPIWSMKPDVNAFEKIENGRLEAAQRSIGKLVAVKGPKGIGNTLANYDEALRQINAALYFSTLMEAVHPDAAFRDRAMAMTRKVSAVQTVQEPGGSASANDLVKNFLGRPQSMGALRRWMAAEFDAETR